MAKENLYAGFWKARYLADGSSTLDEMIENLELAIQELREMQEHGIFIGEEDYVDAGEVVLLTKRKETAEMYGFEATAGPGDDDDEELDFDEEEFDIDEDDFEPEGDEE